MTSEACMKRDIHLCSHGPRSKYLLAKKENKRVCSADSQEFLPSIVPRRCHSIGVDIVLCSL